MTHPTRTSYVVQYDTPLIQKSQEFSTQFAAENFADHLTTSVTGNVHNAMVLEIQSQIIHQYHRKEED